MYTTSATKYLFHMGLPITSFYVHMLARSKFFYEHVHCHHRLVILCFLQYSFIELAGTETTFFKLFYNSCVTCLLFKLRLPAGVNQDDRHRFAM